MLTLNLYVLDKKGFMKIAHISDIHICSENKKNNINNLKTLLTHITGLNYDHIVITGDLTHNADQRDFKLLRQIFDSYGLLDTFKLSLTIGNHDIFGGIHYAEDIISFPEKCLKLDYDKKVKQFGKYFSEVFEKTFRPVGKIFPYAKDLGDILIIGVNSIDKYSRLKNPFASNGHVSKDELSGLKEILSINEYKEKNKIVLIHHHFNKFIKSNRNRTIWERIETQTMKLRGKNKLIKLFDINKVSVVLHGHVHTIADYERDNVRFINAGGSFEGYDPYNLKYNEIEIDQGSLKVICHSIPKYDFPIFTLNQEFEEIVS